MYTTHQITREMLSEAAADDARTRDRARKVITQYSRGLCTLPELIAELDEIQNCG